MSNKDKEPDSNPMHSIGYGRGDDYVPKKTQSYSFVDPDRIISDKVNTPSKVDPIENLTTKEVVTQLIERNLQAWKSLPTTIRTAFLERPQDFQLIPSKSPKLEDCDYDILYNGTVWRYSAKFSVWAIIDIVR